MILELVKLAGESELSLEIQHSEGMFSFTLIDSERNDIYSVDSNDAIIAFNSIVLFLSDPEAYLEDMRASLVESSN